MSNSPQADVDILKHIIRYCNNIELLNDVSIDFFEEDDEDLEI